MYRTFVCNTIRLEQLIRMECTSSLEILFISKSCAKISSSTATYIPVHTSTWNIHTLCFFRAESSEQDIYDTQEVIDVLSSLESNQDWGYVDVREHAHMFYWLFETTHPDGADNRPLIFWIQVSEM